MWRSWGHSVLSQSSSGSTNVGRVSYFQKVSNVALSDDQITKSQILGVVVNKRSSLFLSQGRAITGPVIRSVTQGGCLPECDSGFSVPVPTISSENVFTLEDACPLDIFPVLSSTAPWSHPWSWAEGESFSSSCLCGLVSPTARWQAGIAGSWAPDWGMLSTWPLSGGQ